MAIQEKQLGQARENSTNAVSVYSPAASTTALIKGVMIANTTVSDVTVRIFVDDDGTTYDENTAIAYDVTVLANNVWYFDTLIAMNNSSGNIAYRSSVANALTITIFGAEIT